MDNNAAMPGAGAAALRTANSRSTSNTGNENSESLTMAERLALWRQQRSNTQTNTSSLSAKPQSSVSQQKASLHKASSTAPLSNKMRVNGAAPKPTPALDTAKPAKRPLSSQQQQKPQ
ncbi:hypothetical protein HDU98_005506, partial [Podochytrium sp. JEL0797]